MILIANIVQNLLPIGALILLLLGLLKKGVNYITSALCLSIITLIIYYQNSGGVILGNYFDATNALMSSISLIVLTCAALYIIHLNTKTRLMKYIAPLAQAFIVLINLFLLANLWINASFLANRLDGTPIIQVALIEKPSYCNYKYVFYKITRDGVVDYLCPNYYGLLPKIGHLEISPDFITRQLSIPNKKQLLLLQQNKKVN